MIFIEVYVVLILWNMYSVQIMKYLLKSYFFIFENFEFIFIKKFLSKKKGKLRKIEGIVRSL